MKRNLLAIGLVAFSLPALAQTTSSPKVLTHVDTGGQVYVGKGALWYNGGGMQLKDTGNWENHGNVMLVASDATNDVFRTLDAGGNNRTYTSGTGYNAGGSFVNKLNEAANFASPNTTDDGDQYTYGQLYIQDIAQGNIVGVVNQEHANVNHGDYQQISLPFYDKEIKSLSQATELNKTFTNVRWSKDEILKWNNTSVVFDPANLTTKTLVPSTYYILGNNGNIIYFGSKKTLVGIPYANSNSSITLQNAGFGLNFGTNGNAINGYNEKYNTYLQDGIYLGNINTATAWDSQYGKNIYQFGNPYLTNLDLRGLFISGNANYIPNLLGIRVEQAAGTYSYVANSGGGASAMRKITFNGTNLVGDPQWAMVRPMSVFSIKLSNNNSGSSINFDNLRRFKYTPQTSGVYDVTAKSASSTNIVKQLGVLALDANGEEIGRTYYAVANNAVDGFSVANARMQATASSTDVIGSFEEDAINGGYDNNLTGSYWLYINEANETTFKGKAIPMVIYSPLVKSIKFEIRENEELISNNQHLLSTGIGFYYKLQNGTVQEARQGQTIPVSFVTGGTDNDLYYGQPNGSLSTNNANVKPSRTMVAFNENIDNFVVVFDPNWKKADINVYDMSGKLVLTKSKVTATSDFVIELPKGNRAYVVSVQSEKGEKVNAKIVR